MIRHHGVRRRFILALLGVVALAGIVAIARLGFEWKQALDDVDAMIVTPVVLALTPEPILNAPAPADALVSAASAIPTIAPTAAPENDDPVNILLLGTDARADEEISRTDAIILLHINLRTGRVSMLSFPRDLMVDAPGFGRRKINSVYLLGETRLGKGYGAALLKRTVSDLVGVPVHYFALINFDGFRKVIDLAGGIFIDVPRVIDDPFYPVDAFPGDTRTMRVRFDRGGSGWMANAP